MMKKKIAYVLSSSQKDIFLAGNIVSALNKYMPGANFDAIIYYDYLDDSDKAVLSEMKNVFLRKFECQFENKISAMFLDILSFCRYEIFKLLNDYENVIWLDKKIAIQGSIEGLTSYGNFGAAFERNSIGSVVNIKENFKQDFTDESYDMDAQCYSDRIMTISDKLGNFNDIYKWLYEATASYADFLLNPAQGIINLALQKFNIRPNVFDMDEYACLYDWEKANVARIVLFNDRFWKDSRTLRAFPEWHRTHLEWLRLGGKDFDRRNIDLRNIATREPIITIEQMRKIYFKLFGIRFFTIEKDEISTKGFLFGKIRIFNIYCVDVKKKMSFVEYIFSIRNEGDYKVIRFFGIKIKLNRRSRKN
ncbi:MAG: hypothetical protein LBC92_03385 [Rickettsiales bacterium]|jgi:hypothetical protein|nr:hypothetical protein [Rickettsiales bacterium]